eukprot:4467108-Amphidinium_carterae.1
MPSLSGEIVSLLFYPLIYLCPASCRIYGGTTEATFHNGCVSISVLNHACKPYPLVNNSTLAQSWLKVLLTFLSLQKVEPPCVFRCYCIVIVHSQSIHCVTLCGSRSGASNSWDMWLAVGPRMCFRDAQSTTSTCTAGMLQALIAPDFSKDSLASSEFSWPQWEAEVFLYQRESGKLFPMEIRVSVVLNRAPTQIAARLQMQAADSAELRTTMIGWGHRETNPGTGRNDTTPMDVDCVGKGRGGKGGNR